MSKPKVMTKDRMIRTVMGLSKREKMSFLGACWAKKCMLFHEDDIKSYELLCEVEKEYIKANNIKVRRSAEVPPYEIADNWGMDKNGDLV